MPGDLPVAVHGLELDCSSSFVVVFFSRGLFFRLKFLKLLIKDVTKAPYIKNNQSSLHKK